MFGSHTAHRRFMRLRLELHMRINAPIPNTFNRYYTHKVKLWFIYIQTRRHLGSANHFLTSVAHFVAGVLTK